MLLQISWMGSCRRDASMRTRCADARQPPVVVVYRFRLSQYCMYTSRKCKYRFGLCNSSKTWHALDIVSTVPMQHSPSSAHFARSYPQFRHLEPAPPSHRPALPSPPNRSPPRPPPRRHGWHPWGRCGTGPPALNRMSAGTAPVGPGPARPRGGPIRQPGPHRRELCRRRAPSPAAGRAGRAGCGGHRGGARALLLGSVRRGRVDSDGRPTCPCYLSTEESVRRRIVETDARQLWVLSGTGMAAGKMRRISRRAGVNAPARESACGLSSRRSPLFALLSLLPIRHSPLCTCSFVRFHTHPKQRD